MNDDRELRRILREADPAAGAELSPSDRAPMRAAVVEAARVRRTTWLRPATLRFAAAGLVACGLVLVAGRVLTPEVPVPANSRPAPTASTAPAPVAAPPAIEVPAAVLKPATPLRPGRVRAVAADDRPKTRIVFTAPEGTRIFWFGSTTTAKEDAS